MRLGFYTRPANAYFELQELLGKDMFQKALLEYMNRWNGKHPIPSDFFLTFNDVVGEDLSWLFDDLMQTTKKMDYKLIGVSNSNFSLKNNGQISAPVNVVAYKNSEVVFNNWYNGFKGDKKFDVDLRGVDKLVIDPEGYMVEFIRNN